MEHHRFITQMVCGVTHEINTPLGIACTALSIIDRRLSSPHIGELFKNNNKNKEIFSDILEATAFLKQHVIRAHKLVEGFKKISVSQMTETKETVDLTKLIGDAVELFKINARHANISINIQTHHFLHARE